MALDPDDRQEVRLRLVRAHDMFEMPQTDLFSEYRNFLTGIDFCISELRARFSRRPVRLVIQLPPQEITDELGDRFGSTLRRYCDHRIRYDVRERKAQRIGGLSALRYGLPMACFGVLLAVWANAAENTGAVFIVADLLGWVFAWVGLWFPFDQIVFYPLAYSREERVLRLIREADLVFEPYTMAIYETRF